MTAPPDFEQAAAARLLDLGHVEVEVRVEGDERWLSIPVGDAEAIEVERADDGDDVFVVYRRWDRSHGLAKEDVLVTLSGPSPDLTAHVVAGVLTEDERRQAAVEAEMEGAPGL